MLAFEDSEISQLSYDQHGASLLNYAVQYPALNTSFSRYTLLTVTCSMLALGILAAYFNS